jgi:uncharacterized membrane protein
MTMESLFGLIFILIGLIVWTVVTYVKMGQIDSRLDLAGRWNNRHKQSNGSGDGP